MIKLYRMLNNYYYVVKCFNLLKKDDFMKSKYSVITEDNVSFKFPKVSLFGIMYFYIFIPKQIDKDEKLISDFLTEKMRFINEALLAMTITSNSAAMSLTKIKDEDNEQLIYLFKFKPFFSTRILFWGSLQFGIIGVILYKLIFSKYAGLLFNKIVDIVNNL